MAFFKRKNKSDQTKPSSKSTPFVDERDDDVIEPEVIEPEILLPEDLMDSRSSKQEQDLDDNFDEDMVEDLDSTLTDDEILGSLIKSPQPDTSSEKSLAKTDPVSLYLREISKYPLLTREEEKKWALRYYETKDPKAAEVLVTSNLRFVVKIASEYSKFGSRLIDLIQEGNVGLMQGVREFNPYKGVKLISYAVWWIRGYIQEYLMKQYSLVKIGTTQNQRKLFYKLQKERETMERLGFDTVVKQLSGQLEIPEDEIVQMSQRMQGGDVSLSAPLGDSDRATLMDLQTTPNEEMFDTTLANLEEVDNLHEVIDELRSDLNERELELLETRLLSDSPLTLQDIGEKNGVSREAVRQMEVRLINKIKSKFLEKTV